MKRTMLTKVGMVVLGGLAVVLGAEAQGPQGGNEPVASLTQVQGTVMVNHGKDYVAARSGTPLRPGARVLTMDKSSASVAYKDSCVKQLKENGLLVVHGPADCEGTGAVKTVGPYYAAAIGSEIKSDASSGSDCAAKEGEERERCCDKKKEGEERDRCLAAIFLSSGLFLSSGQFWAGAAIFGGGAAYVYNAGRNDRAVSPQ